MDIFLGWGSEGNYGTAGCFGGGSRNRSVGLLVGFIMRSSFIPGHSVPRPQRWVGSGWARRRTHIHDSFGTGGGKENWEKKLWVTKSEELIRLFFSSLTACSCLFGVCSCFPSFLHTQIIWSCYFVRLLHCLRSACVFSYFLSWAADLT